MKKLYLAIVFALAMPVLTSCDDFVKDNPVEPNPVKPEIQITDISITGNGISAEGTVTLTVGTSLKLAVELTPQPTKSVKLIWTSSDESLLTISSSGLLKAKAAGTVVVTVCPADYPEVTAQITVTIVDDDDDPTADEEMDVDDEAVDQSKSDARGACYSRN